MQQSCLDCSASFEISKEDLALLAKLSPVVSGVSLDLPPPTRCPECRLIQRLAFYNCRTLHRRTCDSTGNSIISVYSADKPYVVFDVPIWYGDSWNPLEHGRPFDPSRNFFDQFAELMHVVPLPSRAVYNDNVNSDYTNDNYKTKDSYLVFGGEQAQNCFYGQSYLQTSDCLDFLHIHRCELCYECVHCNDCYAVRWSRFCQNCSESRFLRDCIGCRDCFGCVNLRQKQYCIFNEQKTREEYDEFMSAFRSGSAEVVRDMRDRFESFAQLRPVKAMRGEQNMDCVGDNLNQSEHAFHCYDCNEQRDTRYCSECYMSLTDSMDIHVWGDRCELCYNTAMTSAGSRGIIGCYYVFMNCDSVLYSAWCSRGTKNCFGCIGLQHKEYCILNTQYTKEEYEKIVPQIVERMRANGEWGEYFPETMSMFGYNETMAQSFFPLTKDQATSKGYQWCDSEPTVNAQKTVDAQSLPDRIEDVPDGILEWAIICEASGKPFKLIRQELEFYRAQRLPIPRRHPDQRHMDRFALKNPYRLFSRSCMKCGKEIETTYAPERPEIVYCEQCYLASVY